MTDVLGGTLLLIGACGGLLARFHQNAAYAGIECLLGLAILVILTIHQRQQSYLDWRWFVVGIVCLWTAGWGVQFLMLMPS